MESKNLSILLTDLRGYSEKSANSSRSEIADLVKTHNRLLRPVIDFYRGRVVKGLGDSFLCVFESATDASMCAIAVQVIVQEYNKNICDSESRLAIRVMINSGDVTIDDGDIYGEAVNIVSAMEKLPEFKEGGIGLSESTYLLMNRQEILAEAIGEFSLKGNSGVARVYRVCLEKQNLKELPTKLLSLVQQLSQGKSVEAPLTFMSGGMSSLFRRRLIYCALVALIPLALGLHAWRRTHRRRQVQPVLMWIRQSHADGKDTVLRENWQGPPQVFRRLDRNGDGVLTPDEMLAY